MVSGYVENLCAEKLLMIAATVNSQACWLLTCEPNTVEAVRLEVEMPTIEQRGLTGCSSRRPDAVLPRFAQSWISLLEAAQFATMRDASLTAQDEPILVPIWRQAYRPASQTAALVGGLTIAWTEGWASWAINPGSLAGYDYAAPLLFGRFTSPPRLVAVSGALIQAQLEVEEDAPAAYAIAPAGGILAADTLSGGFPVFPFASMADWSRSPKPGLGVTDVERIATGPGRMKATIFYPQVPERVFSVSMTSIGRTEEAQLIAWWIRRGGIADAHLVPLVDLGVVGGGTILARHTNQRLVLDHVGPFASAELAWRETAPEAAVPPGETPGSTIGRLPAEAWFFQIDLDFNGALQTWNLTNWEGGATANLIDWAYNACDFDGLVQSIDLDDDECGCTFRYFAGGPWDNWLPGNLAARGKLTIYRANVSPAGVFSGFAQVWSGELKRPEVDGPIVKWRGIANAFFGRSAPRQIMSTACGTWLFKPRCGLALSDWTFNAVIAAVSGNVVTIGTITRANGGSLPAGFGAADWFALGWLGWSLSGRPYRRGVLTSTAIGGGQILLTLERPAGLAVSSSVIAVPGCDRIYANGCTKFANTDNHRGFDQMPSIAPSFVMPQRNTSSAKK